MSHKQGFFLKLAFLLFTLLLGGCGSTSLTPTSEPLPHTATPEPTSAALDPTATVPTSTGVIPEFVNHDAPELAPDMSVFEAECGAPDAQGYVSCEPPSDPLGALGCDAIFGPLPDAVGALDPAYPIAYCTARNANPDVDIERVWMNYAYQPEGNYFYITGCRASQYVRFVIYKDGQFALVKTEDEFRELFAPIETEQEALGYVLAVTGLDDLYDLEYNADLEYFGDFLEDTHATTVADGYVVNLFQKEVCGCGPHPTYAVSFHVTSEGYVKQIERVMAFKDPAEDGMCID
jgi:hypothetical protein